MKKCQKCGFQDIDEINFCRECGGAMKNAPQMVVPLGDVTEVIPADQITEAFKAETETVVGSRFQSSLPTLSTRKPQNKKLIFAVFGVLFAAALLIAGAAGALLYFYIQNNSQVVEVKPTPVPKSEKTAPSSTPKPSPNATPLETPEEKGDLIFTPPTKPTRKGSFIIKADTDKWQLSEIETVGSETFQTSVVGTIVLDEIGSSVSPAGVESNKNRRIFKEYKTGALLMRTRFANGKTSNIQPVSASDVWENDPDETGRIEFLINDNSPDNNQGEFVVSVEMVSVKN